MTIPTTARETFTGRYVDLADPRPEDICVEDIAHHLSLLCRYGGSCRRFYSVAEHAVLVSHRVRMQGGSREQQLIGLHHDSPEAYLVDIPRPQKLLIGAKYEHLTHRIEKAIWEALDLPGTAAEIRQDPVIKDADEWALFVEARMLLPSEGKRWNEQYPGRVVTPSWFWGGWEPRRAEDEFLRRHAGLTK